MILVDWLYSIGDKIGILQVVMTEKVAAPEKVQTRTVHLKDLATEIQAEEVRSLAHLPEELAVPFDKVFESAGIQPVAGGWTVQKLGSLLRTEPYRSMPREAAQKALLTLLADQKVSVEDLVRDAITRDKALDAFEEVAHSKMNARSQTRQVRMAEIQTQIEALQKQCRQFQEEQAADQRLWQQWHDGKINFEKDMAWAIGYVVDRPVVTIDTAHS
jgi:hypothetical protein